MKKLCGILILAILLSGCASNPPLYKTDVDKEGGMPIHGNFCGPNIPAVAEQNTDKQIETLKSISAIDKIDSACKEHDIYYAEKGYFDASCDDELIDAVSEAKGNLEDERCRKLASYIAAYFIISSANYYRGLWESKDIDLVGKIALTSVIVLAQASMLFGHGLMLITDTAGAGLADGAEKVPFLVVKRDGVEHSIPPRYFKCK